MLIPEIYSSPYQEIRKATLFTGLLPLYLGSLNQSGKHQTSSAITPDTTSFPAMNWLFPKETTQYQLSILNRFSTFSILRNVFLNCVTSRPLLRNFLKMEGVILKTWTLNNPMAKNLFQNRILHKL